MKAGICDICGVHRDVYGFTVTKKKLNPIYELAKGFTAQVWVQVLGSHTRRANAKQVTQGQQGRTKGSVGTHNGVGAGKFVQV